MKNPAATFPLLACACISLAMGGCSLFHHEHKPKPWHPKTPEQLGPMEESPKSMEAQPTEAQPRPIEPEPMEAQ